MDYINYIGGLLSPFHTQIAQHHCNEDPSIRHLCLFTLYNNRTTVLFRKQAGIPPSKAA